MSTTTPKADFIKSEVFVNYADSLGMATLLEEVKKRLYKIADKMADEIVDKFKVETMLMDRSSFNNPNNEVIITMKLTPKEEE